MAMSVPSPGFSSGTFLEHGRTDVARLLFNVAEHDSGRFYSSEPFPSQVANLRRPSEVFCKRKGLHWKGIDACGRLTSACLGRIVQDGGADGSWEHRIAPKHSNASTPMAVATSAHLAFDKEIRPCRLDYKLRELKILRDSLKHANNLDKKFEVLNSSPRVRAVFGGVEVGPFIKPIISLALETCEDYEIYLLKCLVGGGQEHVLEVAPAWLDQLEKSVEKEAPQNGSQPHVNNGMRHAFSKLLHTVRFSDGESSSHHELRSGELTWFRTNGSARDGQDNTNPPADEFYEGLLRDKLSIMLKSLIKTLREMETFYDSIGGIIGYQVAALELMKDADIKQDSFQFGQKSQVSSNDEPISRRFFVPTGPDLLQDKSYAAQAAVWGLESLPQMGEIYPLGGAGDRLGLVDDSTGECLPVAMLPYCGRTLLEGLIRDLQAREYLHFKIYGQQHITPVAIMTSAAKKNTDRVTGLCENRGWFGRGRSNFCLFEQPLIPAVAAEDGCWLTREPLAPILKPGGHGVIWKLACDKGVFDWFYKKGRRSAIVRQISNPIAATDVTLLALAGVGSQHNKKFGFASCERNVGAAEGVNVLVERNTGDGWEYCITCIEYTEFSKLGIPDVPVSPGSMQAQYPANTNVLYVDLPAVEQIASVQSSASLPGMILNLKKPINFEDYTGASHSTYAGRIECTMQNVADFLSNKYQSRLDSVQYDSLDTFVIYNERRKVTSSAKRRRKPTDFSLHQTPDGSFFDVLWNAHELLTSCMVDMPEMESKQCYIESGPPFIVLFNPAIGPLWDIVRQKIHGGSITRGSELQLEIAELYWRDVQLNGSLLVLAENVVGALECKSGENILQYGEGCGRCKLQRVQISNQGVDWSCEDNVYWQHKVRRLESLKIILCGNSEFEAHDVILEGSHTFEVPDGYKMTVTKDLSGLSVVLDHLPTYSLPHGTWYWNYTVQDGGYVHLTLESLENNSFPL